MRTIAEHIGQREECEHGQDQTDGQPIHVSGGFQ